MSQIARTPQRPTPPGLPVQGGLVGHVHLDVLAEHDPKRAIGEEHVGDVRPTDSDPIIKSNKVIEPTGGFAVLLGQVDRLTAQP